MEDSEKIILERRADAIAPVLKHMIETSRLRVSTHLGFYNHNLSITPVIKIDDDVIPLPTSTVNINDSEKEDLYSRIDKIERECMNCRNDLDYVRVRLNRY